MPGRRRARAPSASESSDVSDSASNESLGFLEAQLSRAQTSDAPAQCPFCDEVFEEDGTIDEGDRLSKHYLLTSHIWAVHPEPSASIAEEAEEPTPEPAAAAAAATAPTPEASPAVVPAVAPSVSPVRSPKKPTVPDTAALESQVFDDGDDEGPECTLNERQYVQPPPQVLEGTGHAAAEKPVQSPVAPVAEAPQSTSGLITVHVLFIGGHKKQIHTMLASHTVQDLSDCVAHCLGNPCTSSRIIKLGKELRERGISLVEAGLKPGDEDLGLNTIHYVTRTSTHGQKETKTLDDVKLVYERVRRETDALRPTPPGEGEREKRKAEAAADCTPAKKRRGGEGEEPNQPPKQNEPAASSGEAGVAAPASAASPEEAQIAKTRAEVRNRLRDIMTQASDLTFAELAAKAKDLEETSWKVCVCVRVCWPPHSPVTHATHPSRCTAACSRSTGNRSRRFSASFPDRTL
eukprot:Rhum_TRINITY_DN7948_c0_g1::Rhum_TRINITY_DN7948_c0_g1_i1::g.25352::m.25352